MTSLCICTPPKVVCGIQGDVVTVDIGARAQPPDPRVRYLTGNSIDPSIVEAVYAHVNGRRAMVVLDSYHSEEHVYQEMLLYSALVQPGLYLIVEDSNCAGNPVTDGSAANPLAAIRRFMQENRGFQRDEHRERYILTPNPEGFLRRA